MFGHFFILRHFVCLKLALWPDWPKYFRSFQKTSICDRKIPKTTGWNAVNGNIFLFFERLH